MARFTPWVFAAFNHRATLGRGIGAVVATVGWLETSFVWLLAILLLYVALVVLSGLLDSAWSQGPSGPPPPETYS